MARHQLNSGEFSFKENMKVLETMHFKMVFSEKAHPVIKTCLSLIQHANDTVVSQAQTSHP